MVSIIEKIVVNLLSGFSEKDLAYAVKNDVSLVRLSEEHLSRYVMGLIRGAAKIFSGQHTAFTTKNVLVWLSESNPTLYNTIIGNNGSYQWLDKQIQDFRQFLWS